jgi:hypothetical protein
MSIEKPIMQEGILLSNTVFKFLFKCLAVISQVLLELLEADVFEFRQVFVHVSPSFT